jgi:AraC-like DNA-binding protein
MTAMTVGLDGTLTACRDPSSFNAQQAIATNLDSLRYSINPPRPAIAGELDSQRRASPPLRATTTLRIDEMYCELLKFARGDATEMEFSLASHLIILLPDGMSGGCEWRNGERAGKLSSMPPNTILFNPAQDYLRLLKRPSQASCRLLSLTIAPKVADRLTGGKADTASVRFIQRIGLDDENVRRTLLAFLQEIESPGWNSEFYAETLLTLLVSQLIRCASNLTRPQGMPYRKGGLSSRRLKRALELLESDLGEPSPSLTELARHLELHPASFCRAFKQSTGLSPHRYLLSHRVDCAKEMMREENRSLTEIALDCGFGSSAQFSVVFRRIVGMSPREYRRSL